MSIDHNQRDASRHDKIEGVKKFLSNYTIDVNGKGYGNLVSLHCACVNRNCGIAELLLDHGADIEVAFQFSLPHVGSTSAWACFHHQTSFGSWGKSDCY